ncbi:glycosyltransferase [Azospirillum formosense]|uniref:Glycosyltransferase n=1 Tax=Azospirillum formosense TaxID=861533 RepID=A0ABX2KWY1_9PROT|nr:glycosyltransferase family 2 protein [Azospirillum formosense]MBY3757657.1 glycosyltransferase [Azospirillum formosense]NUB20148.1 glycosyltransferase [Azospirillum formosense]
MPEQRSFEHSGQRPQSSAAGHEGPAPLFTIITPCLNRAALVAEAVDSVLAQGEVAVEHIVVDGGSTDGTLEVLARYPHLRVLTGSDRGVYDAINRGLAIARGAVIGHLNSDDLLLPGALAAVARVLEAAPDADAACGGVTVVETAAGSGAGDRRVREICGYDDPQMKTLRPVDLCRGVPMINARFFRRGLYERVGLYDPSYRYAGDRDFLIRAWTAGMKTVPVAERVYVYRQHAGSMTIIGGMRHMVPWLDEHLRLARRVMDDPSSTPALRREARDWYAFELGRAATRALTAGRVGQAARLALGGTATDPAWPARFALQAAGYCLRRLERAKERSASSPP